MKQSDESLRILKDRYEAGLTTIVELLRVERRAASEYYQLLAVGLRERPDLG